MRGFLVVGWQERYPMVEGTHRYLVAVAYVMCLLVPGM
jgi:hypothetical protein